MGLTKDLKMFDFEVFSKELIVQCKAFEDDFGVIELAWLLKISPHTKHINTILHHFREYVHKGFLHIIQVYIDDQFDGTCTKNIPHNVFLKHQKTILGL